MTNANTITLTSTIMDKLIECADNHFELGRLLTAFVDTRMSIEHYLSIFIRDFAPELDALRAQHEKGKLSARGYQALSTEVSGEFFDHVGQIISEELSVPADKASYLFALALITRDQESQEDEEFDSECGIPCSECGFHPCRPSA